MGLYTGSTTPLRIVPSHAVTDADELTSDEGSAS